MRPSFRVPRPLVATAPGGTASVRVIRPPSNDVGRALAEAWRQRSALWYFGKTFLGKRYAGTWLGLLWLPLRPSLSLITGALVYGGILGVSTGRIPYFLWLVLTSASWRLFSETAYFATRSLEITRKDLRRIYVPRLLPLVASSTTGLVDLVLYLALGIGATVYYVIERHAFYLSLRPATFAALAGWALLVLLGLSIGLWLAHLAPIARDVRWTLSYVLGLWYLLTPVIYPVTKIPAQYRFLVDANPATGPIELVKYGLLNAGNVTWTEMAWTGGILVLLIGGGLRFFVRRERVDIEAM